MFPLRTSRQAAFARFLSPSSLGGPQINTLLFWPPQHPPAARPPACRPISHHHTSLLTHNRTILFPSVQHALALHGPTPPPPEHRILAPCSPLRSSLRSLRRRHQHPRTVASPVPFSPIGTSSPLSRLTCPCHAQALSLWRPFLMCILSSDKFSPSFHPSYPTTNRSFP